jgi:hypothetical protein
VKTNELKCWPARIKELEQAEQAFDAVCKQESIGLNGTQTLAQKISFLGDYILGCHDVRKKQITELEHERATKESEVQSLLRTTKMALERADLMREALEDIAAEPGRCDAYIGSPHDDDDVRQCNRPVSFYEADGKASGEFNTCCDLPEHVEAHRAEIEKARSKGSFRGTQTPIELSTSCKRARDVLAAIGTERKR